MGGVEFAPGDELEQWRVEPRSNINTPNPVPDVSVIDVTVRCCGGMCSSS
jgi:hypothetical protein